MQAQAKQPQAKVLSASAKLFVSENARSSKQAAQKSDAADEDAQNEVSRLYELKYVKNDFQSLKAKAKKSAAKKDEKTRDEKVKGMIEPDRMLLRLDNSMIDQLSGAD